MKVGIWYYSLDHAQLGQVIDAQTIWGETICRVWLPGKDTVVGVPASRLRPVSEAGLQSVDDILFITAAARVADALVTSRAIMHHPFAPKVYQGFAAKVYHPFAPKLYH